MNIKKLLNLSLLSILTTFSVVGCNQPNDSTSNDVVVQSSISLKSNKEQNLKVGEEMTLIYVVKAEKKDVVFSSSDESVVVVDEYAGVTAVGEGQAVVRIALASNENDYVEVNFTVVKSIFMHDNGFYNGQIDFSYEDDNMVFLKGGQMQALVNEKGQSWYFKVHLKHNGPAGGDTEGRWGIGSFLVDEDHPIGDTMFWYGFRRQEGTYAANEFSTYWGGWRYASSVLNEEHNIDDTKYVMDEGVDVTIIRRGISHYFIWDLPASYSSDGQPHRIKWAEDIELFEGLDTYPGIYSQEQLVTASDYEVSTDADFINEKLNDFQLAEEVRINCIDPYLINGSSYQLSSTVLPEITPNKDVTYSLYDSYEGISLTEDGLLTIDKGIEKEFRIKVTSKHNSKATKTQKFFAINKKESTSTLFETGHIVADDLSNVVISSNNITFAGGNNYIPLIVNNDNYVVSMDVTNKGTLNGSELGLMSTTQGYMDYFTLGFNYQDDSKRHISYGSLNGKKMSTPFARNDSAILNETYKLTLVKQNNTIYFLVNDKLLKKQEIDITNTIPVIYSTGAVADVKNVTTQEGLKATEDLLNQYSFFTGGYVNKNGNSYDIACMDISGNDMNWPPMNDYMNGLKFTKQIKGHHTISFTLSNITPLGSGSLDSKILIYLRSEATTASIQLVIKGSAANPEYYLCPNYDDATWIEYTLADYNINWKGSVDVKIVKTVSGCELYFNNIRVFEDHFCLENDNYDWSNETMCTPGIGTFRCGATITNPQITMN